MVRARPPSHLIGGGFSWVADKLLLAGAARSGSTLGSIFGRTGVAAAGAATMNPYARSAALGAGVGGMYGAFSDNTSILGGATTGAALGYGGRVGWQAGGIARRMGGLTSGKAWTAMGKYTKGHIDNTLTRAYNPIRNLKGYVPRIAPTG